MADTQEKKKGGEREKIILRDKSKTYIILAVFQILKLKLKSYKLIKTNWKYTLMVD